MPALLLAESPSPINNFSVLLMPSDNATSRSFSVSARSILQAPSLFTVHLRIIRGQQYKRSWAHNSRHHVGFSVLHRRGPVWCHRAHSYSRRLPAFSFTTATVSNDFDHGTQGSVAQRPPIEQRSPCIVVRPFSLAIPALCGERYHQPGALTI
jgi:hypothetical protein